MSEIYRCPTCDQTASEWMWDEATEQELRNRSFIHYAFTKIGDAVRIPEIGNQYTYKCPYCGKSTKLGDMTRSEKIKIERTGHLDEDLFKL